MTDRKVIMRPKTNIQSKIYESFLFVAAGKKYWWSYKRTLAGCALGRLDWARLDWAVIACAWPDRYATWSNQFNESDENCPKAKKCCTVYLLELERIFDVKTWWDYIGISEWSQWFWVFQLFSNSIEVRQPIFETTKIKVLSWSEILIHTSVFHIWILLNDLSTNLFTYSILGFHGSF